MLECCRRGWVGKLLGLFPHVVVNQVEYKSSVIKNIASPYILEETTIEFQPNFLDPPFCFGFSELPSFFLFLPISSRWPALSPSSFSVFATIPEVNFFWILSAEVVLAFLGLVTFAGFLFCCFCLPMTGREVFLIAPWAIVTEYGLKLGRTRCK
jgi:hypothetical protein